MGSRKLPDGRVVLDISEDDSEDGDPDDDDDDDDGDGGI